MDNHDTQLIKSYLEGDSDSFELLVKKHVDSVYSFVWRYVYRNEDEISDIVQETFLKVWKNLKKFDQTKNFKTWIFTIAKNTSLDWLKRRTNTPLSFFEKKNEEGFESEVDFKDESIDTPENIFDNSIIKNKLEELIKELSKSERAVVILKNSEDMTFEEISEILNEPMNTVKSRYRRAVAILKEKADKFLKMHQ